MKKMVMVLVSVVAISAVPPLLLSPAEALQVSVMLFDKTTGANNNLLYSNVFSETAPGEVTQSSLLNIWTDPLNGRPFQIGSFSAQSGGVTTPYDLKLSTQSVYNNTTKKLEAVFFITENNYGVSSGIDKAWVTANAGWLSTSTVNDTVSMLWYNDPNNVMFPKFGTSFSDYATLQTYLGTVSGRLLPTTPQPVTFTAAGIEEDDKYLPITGAPYYMPLGYSTSLFSQSLYFDLTLLPASNLQNSGQEVNNSAIPEPSTFFLFGIGIFSLIAVCRKVRGS